jgi:segregation and condensation protein A
MQHEVNTEVFRGPIDLLLHLITRQRVDIYEVSLAQITEEYLSAIADLDQLDLENATGFLVVAATLLELKSARLLPARSGEPLDGRLLEERDLLLARLVECATYREAGAWLRTRLAVGERWYPRPPALEPQFIGLAPDPLQHIGTADLAAAAARMLAPKPKPELDTSHVAPIKVSVRDAIMDIAGRLEAERPATFESLCGRALERIEVVVRFLALLELFKAGAIELKQMDRWGEIVVFWTGEVDAGLVASEAEEYSLPSRVEGEVSP